MTTMQPPGKVVRPCPLYQLSDADLERELDIAVLTEKRRSWFEQLLNERRRRHAAHN